MKKYWPHGLLTLVMGLTIACYWGGLNGPFLFDDAPNLDALGNLGGVTSWFTLKAYVMSGWSGPTGRPISLLSFLLNDNTWPTGSAWGFKLTNLKLHMLCGLLLAWVNYLLLQTVQRSKSGAAGIAVLSASIWLLHPLMVSTTLYVVQRMTILAALFMLAGMVGYLKGRLWLRDAQRSPVQAYALMTVSVGLATLLAVLSKENGALLPMLLLVVELFLRRLGGSGPRPQWWWVGLFLMLPALAVVGYLLRLVDFSSNLWPSRPFNQVERLYSEARIIWDYLFQLWLPRVEGAGLYQDGFTISRGILQPISTLWSLVGLGALLLVMPFLYRRLPFVWLAVVFFFCGHLIESTVVGLELYFEHRNYAPALFMFLPLAVGIHWLGRNYAKGVAIFAGLGLVGVLGGLTWQRAELWSDSSRLQTYWAIQSPGSARGKSYLIGRLVDEKQYAQALIFADQAVLDLPESSLLTMNRLRIYVNMRQATYQDFEVAAEKLSGQAFDAQVVVGLRTLVDDVTGVSALSDYRLPTLHLMEYLNFSGPYKTFPLFMRVISYSEARLYLSMGDSQKAYQRYRLAMDRYALADTAMQMFAEMAGAGHVQEAQQMLSDIEQGISNKRYDVRPLGEAYYRREIKRMRYLLNDPIHSPQGQE